MKAMKKVLAFVLALAMVVTAAPVTNAAAKTANLSAGKTVNKSYYAGKTHTLKLTGVTKADAKSTTWKSSNAKVVKIVADSQTKVSAQFKCVKKGTATVTATVTLKNGKTKTYKAQIKIKAPTLTVSPSEMSLTVGQTQAITVKKTPSGAKLSYESSDPGVASVEGKKITAKSAGKATISVQLTNGTKKITKKIAVTVSAAKDGLSVLGLSNPISSEYPNTVWVSDNAAVNVQYVRDGKPVAGESLILTKNSSTSFGAATVANLNYTSVAVTNANGIATFVIGFNNSRIKASDASLVGTFDYKITAANGNAVTDGQVAFAAIGFGKYDNSTGRYYKVRLQNKLDSWAGRPSDINPLALSTNITSTRNIGWPGAQGYTTTNATATWGVLNSDIVVGEDVDYVHSQQVSGNGLTDHQVSFDTFTPQIVLPKSGTDYSGAVKYQQDVNYSTGAYGVYTDDVKIIKLNAKTNELTYATLNFSKLQLSEHTQLTIGTYRSEWGAQQANAGERIRPEVTIKGEADMLANGYQIPLDENHPEVYIRLNLKSAGQVNTDKNAGYEAKDITGVHKTVSSGDRTYAPLKGAKVEWATTTAPMSDVRTLSSGEINTIKGLPGAIDLSVYEKVTYQVPVFPYTGNAVFTCYDKNNNIVAYYVCPTKNNNKTNENVLDLGNYFYKVSRDEAFNQVGTIVSQDDNRVVVNSEKVGVTSLKGTVTIDGMVVPGLDATNDMLYTSVQWSPLPNAIVNATGFVALLGQNIEVIAQLTDRNGNTVSTANETISFVRNGTLITTDWNDIKIVDQVTKTDKNGQAKITFTASEVALLSGLEAICTNSLYDAKLVIKGNDARLADLYWLDADLQFVTTATAAAIEGSTQFTTTAAATSKTVDGIQPYAGTNWEYGVRVVGTEVTSGGLGGVLADNNNPRISIEGLDLQLSKIAGSVGTVTADASKKDRVTATSKKAGKTEIVSRINAKSVTDQIKVGRGIYAGTGSTSINKKLTLNVNWKQNGINAEFVIPNGANIYDVAGERDEIVVYVKVTDLFGNPVADGTDVTFTKDVPDTKVEFVGATTTETVNGIAKITLKQIGTTTDVRTTTVTAEVEGLSNGIRQVYTWVQPSNAEILKIKDGSGDDGIEFTKYNNETGVITLTFTADIVASSLKKEMVTAYYDKNSNLLATAPDGDPDVTEFTIKDVAVNNNEVTITVNNKIGTIDARGYVAVTIENEYPDAGITYTMTSEHGMQYEGASVTFFIPIDSKRTDTNVTLRESVHAKGVAAAAAAAEAAEESKAMTADLSAAAGQVNGSSDEITLPGGSDDSEFIVSDIEYSVESGDVVTLDNTAATSARVVSGGAVNGPCQLKANVDATGCAVIKASMTIVSTSAGDSLFAKDVYYLVTVKDGKLMQMKEADNEAAEWTTLGRAQAFMGQMSDKVGSTESFTFAYGLTWQITSSEPNVLTVEPQGGPVTIKGDGSATLTYDATAGGKALKLSYTVTVEGGAVTAISPIPTLS